MSEPIISFLAEVKQVKSRKTASLDKEYQIQLTTDNPGVLALGTLNATDLIEVRVYKPKEIESGYGATGV